MKGFGKKKQKELWRENMGAGVGNFILLLRAYKKLAKALGLG